ncbi:MAG: maleylpyruvate isomerase family mycothiol-dependent enzyme [Microthrixaceae bacterium]
MEAIVTALAEEHAELDALVGPLTDEGWAAPTPRCPGWTVSDVVLHLAQTDEMALGSVSGTFTEALARLAASPTGATSVDDGAGAIVAAERGAPPAEVYARWRSGAEALRAALSAVEPSTRVQWVVGDLAARTLATTRLAECWIHTGDVLAAFDRPVTAPPRLRHIARLAWRTLPYAFAGAGRSLAGPVAFHLTAPDGGAWVFEPDTAAVTTISGPALDLCQVAGQRARAEDTALTGAGPDAQAVLELVRTFA